MKNKNDGSTTWDQAEKRAKLRDIENSKVLTDEEMELANKLQAKAQAKKMRLVPEKQVKNRAKFAQILQQNMNYLIQIKYLTLAEKGFLIDIMGSVGIGSNCLVDDVSLKNQLPLTQRELAQKIGRLETKISPLVNSLIDKGLLARSESGLEDNNVRSYALFVNPEIIFSGDRDRPNPTLKAMFKKVPKELKKLPVKFL